MSRILVVLLTLVGALAVLPASANAQELELPEAAFAAVVFPGVYLDQGIPPDIGIPAPPGATWADLLGSLAVYADGELCTQADIAAGLVGDVILPLGLPDQPAACSTAGALITWRTGLLPEADMAVRWRLDEGALMTIASLAPLIPEREPPLEQESATLVVPGELLASPIPERGGALWADVLSGFRILADGEQCTVVSLGGGAGDAAVRFGGPYQPEACSREGAVISLSLLHLAGGIAETVLDTTFVMTTDQPTFVLESFAPLPPPMGEPAPEGTVVGTVVIPGDLLAAPTGELLGALHVYANGELCGTIDLAAIEPHDEQGNAILPLGAAAQPAACRTEGALITFRLAAAPSVDLLISAWLVQGGIIGLTNFAPPPPSTGGPGPVVPSEPTPTPAAPLPPDSGTGFAPGSGAAVAAWLLAVGLACTAVAGVSLSLARRR